MTGPYAMTYDIPYRQGVNQVTLNTSLYNIFRLKDVSRVFFCEGKLDNNNLVYLNVRGVETLQQLCREGKPVNR